MRMRFHALLLAGFLCAGASHAEQTTPEEMQLVAENFVELIIARDGSWGGHATAQVQPIEPLKRRDTLLGYYCNVEPVGYFILSLYRELGPIRAYSTRSNIDPESDHLLVAFIKDRQERLHAAIAQELGHEVAPRDDFRDLLEVHFDEAWEILTASDFDPRPIVGDGRSHGDGDLIYDEGETLLRTTWNQDPPYNHLCPDLGCEWPNHGNYNTNAVTGCVATAGAMVMKYWNWPPVSEGSGAYAFPFDWPHMADNYYYSNYYSDMISIWDGVAGYATYDEIIAVARVMALVGQATGMDYGCATSGTPTAELEGAFENHFRYHNYCTRRNREDYNYNEWWGLLQSECDLLRPVAYRIPNHAIVVDGWDAVVGLNEVHVVYGHNGSDDGWFNLDWEFFGGDDDYMIGNIFPDVALGQALYGTYSVPSYPYRYLDRHCWATDTEFAAGHNLQVLGAGLKMTHLPDSPPESGITFRGAPSLETVVYLYGDPENESRIRVHDGALKIRGNGEMIIH